MKKMFKILLLCLAMMFTLAGVSMAKTDKSPDKIIRENQKIANYLKSKKFVNGNQEAAQKAYNDALASYTMAVALDAQGSTAQTKALVEATKKSLESSLTNLLAVSKGDNAFTKIVLGVLDALKGIFKITVTVEDKRSKTITDPVKPLSYEFDDSEISPFDADWGDWNN